MTQHGNKHEEREVLPGIRMSQPASVWAETEARNAAHLGVVTPAPLREEIPAPEEVPFDGTAESVAADSPSLEASVKTEDLPQTGAAPLEEGQVPDFDFGTSLNIDVCDVLAPATPVAEEVPPPAVLAPSQFSGTVNTDGIDQ